MTGQPLAGVRVLDLSRLLPGPMCSWYLQGLGAEVVRLEDPREGDYLRHVPPLTPDGTGAWFHAINAGKRSVTVDLKDPGGAAAARAMLPRFDVLLESFRPGVMARLGLDPAALRAEFPRLVIASLSGFGQDGPLRDAPGHDLGYCALAGALSLGKRRDGAPDVPGVQMADIAGGALTGALAIAAALYGRERTGQGAWLDLSLTEGVMALASLEIAATAASGRRPEPGGTLLTGALPVYGLYRCADGKVLALAALEPKFQAVLREKLGPDVPLRREPLEAAFASQPRDHWVDLLGEACVTPMLELDELASHPQHRARRALVGEGAGLRVRPPWPGCEDLPLRPAPRLGEHNREELP